MPAPVSAKRKQQLLAVLADGWSIARACRDAGIGRSTVKDWRQEGGDHYDPVMAAEIDDAIEAGTDKLEDHGQGMAYDGDTTMTIFLLKGRRPTKYRDNAKVTVAGDPTAPLSVEVKGVSLASILEFAEQAGADSRK